MRSARLTLEDLLSFPWIRDGVAAGTLALHGYRFDIHAGVLARVTDTGLEPAG